MASGTITTIQDGVDYLTWTFFYRRLLRNPSYYGLEDSSPKAVASFLSTVIEGSLYSLKRSGCVEVEEGVVRPTTLGRIAAYYYMSHKTLAMFGEELGEVDDDDAYLESVSFEKLLEVLAEAAEYDDLPVRHNEDQINEEISADVRFVGEGGGGRRKRGGGEGGREGGGKEEEGGERGIRRGVIFCWFFFFFFLLFTLFNYLFL